MPVHSWLIIKAGSFHGRTTAGDFQRSTFAKWDESRSAPHPRLAHTGMVFDSLFERSADAIGLFDPQTAGLIHEKNSGD
jgi:hypothetical protein